MNLWTAERGDGSYKDLFAAATPARATDATIPGHLIELQWRGEEGGEQLSRWWGSASSFGGSRSMDGTPWCFPATT
jgi:hypothetical protein